MICSNTVNCKVASSVTTIQKSDVSTLSNSLRTLAFASSSKLATIEEDSFSYFNYLTSVDLSNCLKLEVIDQNVFFHCSNLKTVTFPQNGILNSLLGGSFANTSITTVTFPASLKYLKYHKTEKNRGAFSCTPLQSINYYGDNNLVTIQSYTFKSTNLTEFELGPNVKTIMGYTFESTGQNFKRIFQKKANVNGYFVENGVLYQDTKLVFCPPAFADIKLAKNTETIGPEAFVMNLMTECTFLIAPLKTIAKYAFHSCPNIRKIVFPPTLETVDHRSLCFCKRLEFVSFSGSISLIPTEILYSCTSLKIIIIPDGVKEIQSNAFTGCTSLRYLYIPDTVAKIASDAFTNNRISKCGIICSEAEKAVIKEQTQMSESSFSLCPKEQLTRFGSCRRSPFLSNTILHLCLLS